MVAVTTHPAPLRSVDQAVEYVRSTCFATGPPRRVGAELEWIVCHADDPHRPVAPDALVTALGRYAPRTLAPDSPGDRLPAGGVVTVEPGGQVEISTAPHASLARLYAAASADLELLTVRLADHGLRLVGSGIDPHRRPRQLLHTPRYAALATAFARRGSAGATMMCATASTQVCLDAGEPSRVAARWSALHEMGPALLALFATSRRHAGRDTGWVSARMRAWWDTDPPRTRPVAADPDPATAWARYAMAAPVLCVRRPGGWETPVGVTFADWVRGALTPAPTVDDLAYHLSTLFPPVRPRGYLEVRYLDAQPPDQWLAPVAVLTALLSDDAVTDTARDLAAPAAGAWISASRAGLTDPVVARAARDLADLACRSLDRTDLTPALAARVAETVGRRLAGGDVSRPAAGGEE